MDLSHLLMMDAAPFPIEQRYREGDHIPSSKNVWDVGLHVLKGQKAVGAMVRAEGWGVDQERAAGAHQIHQDGTAGIPGNGGALQEC